MAASQPRTSSNGGAYEELSARGAKPGLRRKTWLLRGAGLCVLLGMFLATSLTLGRRDNLSRCLQWVHTHRAAGLLIFGLLYVWFTICFLPPALLAACAGALYGFLAAIPVVWACAVVGETVSFLLGRFLLRRWVAELTADWPMWVALNAALAEDGWKLVALLRVSPAIPFSLLNYALGASSLPFAHYFWPSVVGVVPSLIIYVWLGSLAVDVTEAVSGSGTVAAPPAAKITILVVCGVSALAVVVLSAVYTKRAIDRRLASVGVREETRVEEEHYLLERDEDEEAGAALLSAGAALAPAGAPEQPAAQPGASPRRHGGVRVSVETPVLVVPGSAAAVPRGGRSPSPLRPGGRAGGRPQAASKAS